jgi:hypothetical protein
VTTFTPEPGLNERVAALIAAPAIARLAEQVESAAQQAAPRVKRWNAVGDARTRPWHRSADGQECPDNLRFALEHSPRTHDPHPPGYEMLRYPRDPAAYYLQTRDCRCWLDYNDRLAQSIGHEGVRVTGARVTATISTRFPRAAESEIGTAQDAPARFMARGLQAARLT